MSGTNIHDIASLDPSATLTGTDLLMVEQADGGGNHCRKTPLAVLAAYLGAGGSTGITSINGNLGPAVTLGPTDVGAVPASLVSAPSGVASLDSGALVPRSQLPIASGGLPGMMCGDGASITVDSNGTATCHLTAAVGTNVSSALVTPNGSTTPVALSFLLAGFVDPAWFTGGTTGYAIYAAAGATSGTDGTAALNAAIAAAKALADAGKPTPVRITGNLIINPTIATSITIASDVELQAGYGVITFIGTAAITVTITGVISGPPMQLFNVINPNVTFVGPAGCPHVFAEWWGAQANAWIDESCGTDNTATRHGNARPSRGASQRIPRTPISRRRPARIRLSSRARRLPFRRSDGSPASRGRVRSTT
jgi:hypothetical protein